MAATLIGAVRRREEMHPGDIYRTRSAKAFSDLDPRPRLWAAATEAGSIQAVRRHILALKLGDEPGTLARAFFAENRASCVSLRTEVETHDEGAAFSRDGVVGAT